MMPASPRPAFTALIIAIGAALLICSTAWAAIDSQRLAERLATHAPQCGHFEQSRWLADLETHLNSRGHFEQAAKQLIWQTTSPIHDRVVLSEDNADLAPGFQFIAPILGGLLSGDWQALKRHFSIEFSGDLEAWQARLRPNDKRIAERLTHLHLHGNVQVEQVTLTFANDDRLDLTLTAAPCEEIANGDPLP